MGITVRIARARDRNIGCEVRREIGRLFNYVLSGAAAVRGQAGVREWDRDRGWATGQAESRFARWATGVHRVFRPPVGV